MADEPTMTPEEKVKYSLKLIGWIIVVILVIALIFVGIYVLSVALSGAGGFAGDFFAHIQRLFRDATNAFRTARGFGAFIQLILIAGVLGWAINRIMKYLKRK